MKADPGELAGRAVGAGQKHQRAGREALALDSGVEAVAADHVGHALAFAEPPAGRVDQQRADARRLADGLVDRGRGAVVDAAGEGDDATFVARRHREAFGRLPALGDGPMLAEERAHLAELAHRRGGGEAERRAGRAATRRSDEPSKRRRSADMVVPNIDQSQTATTSGSTHSTAMETARIELRSPSSRNIHAPKAARPQPSRTVCSQNERPSEYSPTRWRQKNPARASGRASRRASSRRAVTSARFRSW